MSSVLFLVLFVLSQAKHLVSLFTSILQWVKHSTSFLLVWTFQAFFGSVEVRFWKAVWTCSAVLGLRERKKRNEAGWQCRTKSLSLFLCLSTRNIHFIFTGYEMVLWNAPCWQSALLLALRLSCRSYLSRRQTGGAAVMDDIVEEAAEQKEGHKERFFISFVMVF